MSPLDVRFAESSDAAGISRLNERLRIGGVKWSLSVTNDALTEPATEGKPHRRVMIAADSTEIRAGVVLYHNVMYLRGIPRRLAWVQMPISEGLVDRSHAMAIVQLVRAAVQYEPILISLGVGATTEAWSRFAISLGWQHSFVPFFFYPVDSSRVLRGLRYLESYPRVKKAAALAANLGFGRVANVGLALHRSLKRGRKTSLEVVDCFGAWADQVFEDSLSDYPALASRKCEALNLVYPLSDGRFTRLRVRERVGGSDMGWIIVSAVEMNDNRYFGDLRVGVLVDGLGRAEAVPSLLKAGMEYLIKKGVDLIVANWSHRAWVDSTRRLGFISGPSNYLVMTPKEGAKALEPIQASDIHFTRGDSDGMVSFRRSRPL